jgi:hypothetical protein
MCGTTPDVQILLGDAGLRMEPPTERSRFHGFRVGPLDHHRYAGERTATGDVVV